MNFPTFQKYKQLKEATEPQAKSKSGGNGAVGTKISLGDNNEFQAFEISDDPKSEHYGKNKNLSPVVRAFKGGGNWGWSKDDASGDDKPVKIGTKKLYLAGGAVRSHLKGEKARNIELATNASPDEVYHLLKQNGFEFINDSGTVGDNKKPPHPNRKEGSKQFFWVKRANKNGRPFTFGIRVNEDEFELEVFQKSARGFDGDEEPEPGTQADDANSRDFTINGLYIQLTNDNGPNKDLYDFHGGIHHMMAGQIVPIGGDKAYDEMKKRPSRIMRYMRFMHGYGDEKTVGKEQQEKIMAAAAEGLPKLAGKPEGRKYMMDEFKKGLDKDGTDARKYLKLFKKYGLLDILFPGKMIDGDLPKELSELGDKHMPLAWMLRMNDPDSLEDTGMDPKDLKKIGFLIKSLGVDENMDPDQLEDLTNGYTSAGVSSRKLRDWGTKLGKKNPAIIDAFLAYCKGPRIKLYEKGEDGTESLNGAFLDLIDPFTGQEDQNGIKERRKHMEYDSFRKHMEYMRPI